MKDVAEASTAAVWRALGHGEALGIGSATAGGSGAVVVLTASVPPDLDLHRAGARFADALGVARAEVAVVHGDTVACVVRQWLHQAAQGSGRGVSVRVEEDGDVLRVLVDSVDSSAREVALRLSSPHEPALAALTALLPHRAVEVRAQV